MPSSPRVWSDARASLPRWRLAAPLLVALLGACIPNPGGANRGARAPGSGRGGVSIGGASPREIAVDPRGQYAVYGAGALILADLAAGRAAAIDAPSPRVVAFWSHGAGFHGLTHHGSDARPEQTFFSFDVSSRKITWSHVVNRADLALKPLADGKHIVLWGNKGDLRVARASDGAPTLTVAVDGPVIDIDELPSGSVLVTEMPAPSRADERATPRTVLWVFNPATNEQTCRVEVPSCADEVLVSPDGKRAFLAPTFCGKDPVSVIDLERCKHETTLPGFGPAALAQGGRTVVAFADRDAAEQLPASIKQSRRRYHLLLIDARTLRLDSIELDDWLPRYAAPPSGRFLLLDTSRKPPVQPRLVDLDRREVSLVFGPAIPLEAFVMTPDERHAFVLSNGLYDLRIERRQLDSLPLPFVPDALNLTPDGKTILLREGERLHLMQPDPLRFTDILSP